MSAMLVSSCGLGPAGETDTSLFRTSFTPPPEYRGWWDEIKACSGETGEFGDIRFFEVVGPLFVLGTEFPCGGGARCNGLWEAPHDISIARGHLQTERLVKHEMLHELVRIPGHPAIFEACEVTWGNANSEIAPRYTTR